MHTTSQVIFYTIPYFDWKDSILMRVRSVTWSLPQERLLLNSNSAVSTCGMALQQVRLLSSWLHNGQAAIGHADKGTRGEKA